MPPWHNRRGKIALGYRSEIDNSVQPYGLIVPKSFDPKMPSRLDVVLHGSTRPVGLSELKFIARFDEGDGQNPSPPDQPFIELHPLGRVENCYRWAGRPMSSRRSRMFASGTTSTEVESCCAACRWELRGHGISD